MDHFEKLRTNSVTPCASVSVKLTCCTLKEESSRWDLQNSNSFSQVSASSALGSFSCNDSAACDSEAGGLTGALGLGGGWS